jgi:hypothetical protein
VLIDANGNVVEIEEQVTLASLPPAARFTKLEELQILGDLSQLSLG